MKLGNTFKEIMDFVHQVVQSNLSKVFNYIIIEKLVTTIELKNTKLRSFEFLESGGSATQNQVFNSQFLTKTDIHFPGFQISNLKRAIFLFTLMVTIIQTA